jgi:hypothetical protein
VSRFAIGYSPGEIDRPLAVFVETPAGVLVQRRGEEAAQMLDRPVRGGQDNGAAGQIAPGEQRYFDVVLDGFSTRYFIRTLVDLEPDVIVSMLLADEDNWDRLPRPGLAHQPA